MASILAKSIQLSSVAWNFRSLFGAPHHDSVKLVGDSRGRELSYGPVSVQGIVGRIERLISTTNIIWRTALRFSLKAVAYYNGCNIKSTMGMEPEEIGSLNYSCQLVLEKCD
jgi:hypothetical protein